MAADYEPFATKIEKVIDSYNFMRGQVLFSMKQQLIEAQKEIENQRIAFEAGQYLVGED